MPRLRARMKTGYGFSPVVKITGQGASWLKSETSLWSRDVGLALSALSPCIQCCFFIPARLANHYLDACDQSTRLDDSHTCTSNPMIEQSTIDMNY